MKDTVEKHAPIINRFNPAALISDALYCINVYDDASRYYRNLITLIVMSAALVLASFLLIRRNVMTVFKGYLKILKKNLGMLLIYLVIFLQLPSHFRLLPAKSISVLLKRHGSMLPSQTGIRANFPGVLSDTSVLSTMYLKSPVNHPLCRRNFLQKYILYRADPGKFLPDMY